MERESIIPGRVYAYGCLLKKEIKGFIQVPTDTPDYKLIELLDDPNESETILERRHNLVRELVKGTY